MVKELLSRRSFLMGAAAAVAAVAGRLAVPRAAQPAPSSSKNKLRFGVQTPPQHVSYADIAQTWREADELGFDSAFVFDHFIPIYSDPQGPCLEGWTLLAALAAQTKQVKVGVLVTGNTYRHPAVLAKMAATVDHISNGRLILGLGAAWFELEHTAYGIPFYTPGERARRLGEAVEVIKLLFTQQKSNFKGKYYQLKDALCEPKPLQKPYPPLLIGGMGPKLIQPLAARQANIWHFFVRDGDPQETKKICTDFDALCRKVGREPSQVEKSISLRPPQLAGTPEDVRGRIHALADAGVQHFLISLPAPHDRQLLRRFAQEIMPAFRTI
jgi:F420-dependent oxidoreductase-like protein